MTQTSRNDRGVVRGAIIAESLRAGVALDGLPLTVHKIERVDAGLGDQPRRWTLLWFEASGADADRLATALADALEPQGGWYADFHSDSEVDRGVLRPHLPLPPR